MASYARRFIQHNVRLVGGCCGTTPEHIRQIKAAVARDSSPAASPSAPARSLGADQSAAEPTVEAPPVAREKKSRLANAMARGAFVVRVEMLPPRGYQTERSSSGRGALKIGGVDVVSIPDGQRAGARISALSLAVLIEQQAGIETLLQYACRDRNLLGIQSDLLGAHAMGAAQPDAGHRRSGPRRRLSRRDRGVRRRLDRAHQRRVAAEPRLRRRRPGDRRADRVSHRRRRSTRARRTSTRSCGASSTRSRRARSSWSRGRCSTSAASSGS